VIAGRIAAATGTPAAAAIRKLAAVALIVAGCGSAPRIDDAAQPRILPLPTVPLAENAEGFFCAGVGEPDVIHGDPAEAELTWLSPFGLPAGDARAGRIPAVWPAGYGAVFDPGLKILDATRRIRLQEGDFIDGVCVTNTDRRLIVPPDDSYALECGPMALPDCTGRVTEAARTAWASANGRGVATIRFVNATGAFRILFEDGSTGEGVTVLR